MVFLSFLFIFLGLVLRNLQLSKVLFYDWDEAMYAQIAQEMIKNKSLFTTFNGQIWLDKPPLAHALVAFVFATIGQSEFWARMIMVVISFVLLVLTYQASKKILLILKPKATKHELIMGTFIPTLLLAASPVFIERSALINSDTLIAVSWIGYLLYRETFWAKLFFLTLGVWSKSVMGFYPLLFDAGVWIFQKRKFTISKVSKFFLFISLPSLWYVAGLIKYKNAFIYHHFLSQVFKRITVPIELHFGGKFYYMAFLWEKMGFINIFFIISYILYAIYFVRALAKDRLRFFTKNNLIVLTFMLAPFPFFAFLTIMRTKIYWYVIMFFPFMCISLIYLYIFLKNRFLQGMLFAGVVVYFLVSFIQQTYLSKVYYSPPDRLKLAQCIASKQYDRLAFLVNEEERKVRNVLEAAHYDTTSSFYYGGSPSFVFYVKKKVDYFYSIDEFVKRSSAYPVLVASKNDIDSNVSVQSLIHKKKLCEFGEWLSIVQ